MAETRIGLRQPDPTDPKLYLVRGRLAMLDADIAELFETNTSALNQAVTRNPARFPVEFAFRLSPEELAALKAQYDDLNLSPKSRVPPRAYTEYGVMALPGVLRNPIADEMSIALVLQMVELKKAYARFRAFDDDRIGAIEKRLSRLENRPSRELKRIMDKVNRIERHQLTGE